jgi:DNA-binding transcriptional LysR family regulator
LIYRHERTESGQGIITAKRAGKRYVRLEPLALRHAADLYLAPEPEDVRYLVDPPPQSDGQKIDVRVDGQLAFSSSVSIPAATLKGHGLAGIPSEAAWQDIRELSIPGSKLVADCQ